MTACPHCGKTADYVIAYDTWPRCQERHEDRQHDPASQCIWKNRHVGCHCAMAPDGELVWFCRG